MSYTKTASTGIRIVLLCLLSALAACGGKSEREEACDQAADGYFPILNGIKCVFGSTDDGIAKPSGSGTTGFSGNGPALGYQVGEYEPNNSLNNANPLVIKDAAVAISGQLASANDAADNFVFTPTQTGDYRVYLCADSCDQVLESDSLNLMVLDQSQTTIAATPMGPIGEKTLTIRLNAGVAYYTEVSALGTDESYHLAIAKNVD